MINARDYATLQLAIDAAQAEAVRRGGCDLIVPPGITPVWATPTITSHKVWVVGKRGAIIRQMNPACHGLRFAYPAIQGPGTGGGVFDVTLEAGAGWSEGFTGDGSEGAAIIVENANNNFHIERISATNFGTGIALEGCWNTNISSFHILFCKWAGILIDIGAEIGGGNKIRHGGISNNGYTGSGTPLGLDIRASGGEGFDDLDITRLHTAVSARPDTATKHVLYCTFRDVQADTSWGDGYVFDGSIGKVWQHRITDGWSAYNGGCGLVTLGEHVDGIKWVGELRENGMHGAWPRKGRVSILGSDIASNSTLTPDTWSGIHTDGNVNLTARDNTIGNFMSSSMTQKFAIQGPPGGGPYPHIGPNALGPNLSGDTSGI